MILQSLIILYSRENVTRKVNIPLYYTQHRAMDSYNIILMVPMGNQCHLL